MEKEKKSQPHKKSLEPQAFWEAEGYTIPTITPESSEAVGQGEKFAHSTIPKAWRRYRITASDNGEH